MSKTKELRKEFTKLYENFDNALPKECQNCNDTENLTIHHIVPLAVNGTNNIGNLVRLCSECHNKIHGTKNFNKVLQMEGIQRAKEQGKYKGRPKTYNDNHRGLQHALELFDDRDNNKMTVDDIADITGISRATIYREAKKERTQEQTI